MAITKRWAGQIGGTNVGNVFVTFEGDDSALTGTVTVNEPGLPMYAYSVEGTFDSSKLTLSGRPTTSIEGVDFGELTVVGIMNASGVIQCDWNTTIGSVGTVDLIPQKIGEQADGTQLASQLHMARFNFGAIEVDKNQIIEIAENIRRDFPSVIVTVSAGTDQSRYLDDFKRHQFTVDKAEIIKVYAQRLDEGGAVQIIYIEFGPQVNTAMVQGANEGWVLGQLEMLKRDLRRYERTYITSIKRLGIGINQLMLLAAITFLPSLDGLRDRVILIVVVLVLSYGVEWLHSRYVPYAAIYLSEKRLTWMVKVWPRIVSWLIGIVAAVIAILVGAYLQGALNISSPSPPNEALQSVGASE